MKIAEKIKTINPVGYLKNGKYFSFEQIQGETNDNSDTLIPLYATPIKQPNEEGKSIEECKDEVAERYCKIMNLDIISWKHFCFKTSREVIFQMEDEAILLYAQSQLQQIGEWISVKDKLPEEKVKVLICLTYGSGKEEIQTSYYVKRTKSFDHFMNDIITHWMPLPSPPKISSNDNP